MPVRAGTASDLDAVRDLWLALHRHHRSITEIPLQPDEAVSWRVRRGFYERNLQDGTGALFLADDGDEVVGYAFALLNEAPDDTWGFRAGWTEIYSLSVDPSARGRGVGSALVKAVLADARSRGFDGATVAMMTTNVDAIEFYRERGFRPAEVVLLRLEGDREP